MNILFQLKQLARTINQSNSLLAEVDNKLSGLQSCLKNQDERLKNIEDSLIQSQRVSPQFTASNIERLRKHLRDRQKQLSLVGTKVQNDVLYGGAQSSSSSVLTIDRPRLRAECSIAPSNLLIAERTYDVSHPAYDATAVRNYPGRILNEAFPSDNTVYAILNQHCTGAALKDEIWDHILEEALEEICAIPHANQVFERIAFIEEYAATLEKKYQARYFPGWVNFDEALFLYWLVRRMNPTVLVQSGVSNGLSTAFMVLALVKNGAHGKLHAIDLPLVLDPGEPSWTQEGKTYGIFIPEGKSSGWLVPDAYHHRLELKLGDARKLLPELLDELESVDMFYHDSDHTYNHMMFEFNQIKRRIVLGGLIVADDIAWNASLWDFADQEGVPAYNFKGAAGLAFF